MNTDLETAIETTSLGVLMPVGYLQTLPTISANIMGKVFGETTKNTVKQLIDLTQKSLSAPKYIAEIQTLLNSLKEAEFTQILTALYVHSFALKAVDHTQTSQPSTPLSDTLTHLLSTYSVEDALTFLPTTLTDVLTRHPVDPNRSFVTKTISALEAEHTKWLEKKAHFEQLPDTPYKAKQSATEELDAIFQNIQNLFILLYSGEPYRPKKINSFGEQQNSSRLIRDHEEKIRQATHRANRLIKLKFFEAIVSELQKNRALSPDEKTDIDKILSQPQATKRLHLLETCTLLSKHPQTEAVKAIRIKLTIENWRADFDGNTSVTGKTALLATADGILRAFQHITEDEALFQVADQFVPEKSLKTMQRRLEKVAKQHYPEWTAFIDEKLDEKWPIGKIYSALVIRRIQDAVRASQDFINTPNALPQTLKKGFANTEEFLKIITPLRDAEIGSDISNGFWTKQYELAEIRGITSGGIMHIRKGESFNDTLLSETLNILFKDTHPTPTHFQQLDAQEKCRVLKQFIDTPFTLPLGFEKKLSETSQRLFKDYTDITSVYPESTLVQSDSVSHANPELSLYTLEATSKLIGQIGKLTLLCEDHISMQATLQYLRHTKLDTPRFSRIIFQCAGSDNQKKLLPLLSAAVNFEYISLVNEKGGTSFFGQGDSPWRSSEHTLPSSMTTLQPGKQKNIFKANNTIPYVLNRIAAHITHTQQTTAYKTSPNKSPLSILETLGKAALDAYESQIENTTFTSLLKDNIGIQNTAFSREPKKPGTDILKSVRAIDSASAQQRENNFDGQLAGLKAGVLNGIHVLTQTQNYTSEDIFKFFNQHPVGLACLKTFKFFHTTLDPELPTHYPNVTTKSDIAEIYSALSGKEIPKEPIDPLLRLSRLVFYEAKNRFTSNQTDFRAESLLVLAHWPV